MAVLDAKKTLQNLKKKGFSEAENKSDDHKWVLFVHKDKIIARTKISHGASDLGDSLIKAMAKQCYLSKDEFVKFVQCTLSHNDYLEILDTKNLL